MDIKELKNTIEIKSGNDRPLFVNYDAMYNWWHNEKSTFDDLTRDEKLLLIEAMNFEIKQSYISKKELIKIDNGVYDSFRPTKLTKDELDKLIQEDSDFEDFERRFHLEDKDQANLANIESEVFFSIDEILNRIEETYLKDYFLEY